ncbi:hypothetical protein Tco_0827010, partial [Tanacetum coccineum]
MVVGAGCGRWGGDDGAAAEKRRRGRWRWCRCWWQPWRWWAAATAAGGVGGDDEGMGGAWRRVG